MMVLVFVTYIKFILVLLVIFGMIMILVGINHLFSSRDISQFDDSDSEHLRHDVESDRRVISDYSVFSDFLVSSLKYSKKNNTQMFHHISGHEKR